MRRSRSRYLPAAARAGEPLPGPALLRRWLGGLRRADPVGAAPRRQGPDPRHRARPRPPTALAGSFSAALDRGLQGQAPGGFAATTPWDRAEGPMVDASIALLAR